MDIDFEYEVNYCKNYFIKKYAYIPSECPQCKQKNISLGNIKIIIHPFNIICKNYKCRYRMRITKFSFLDKILPCSIIMKIIEKFLFENCNSISIKKYINAYYNSINIGTINKILKWLRTAFAHYIKDIYRQNKLGKAQRGSNISIDESMFTHSNGNKI